MQNTTTTMGRNIELGCLTKKNVITVDGRMVGTMSGAFVDTATWTIPFMVMELSGDVVDEMNIRKPLLKNPRIMLDVRMIKNIADVVQLNVDVPGLKNANPQVMS